MLWANRNGYFYVLDRVTGEFLLGKPFVKVNWSSGLDANGRPIPTPQPAGAPTYPGNQGGTNWYPPSYSPRTGLFYFRAWEDYATIYRPEESGVPAGRSCSSAAASRWWRPCTGAPDDRHRPHAARSTTGRTRWATARVMAIDPRDGRGGVDASSSST